MPLKDFFQTVFVEIRLLKHLLDAGNVLASSHTRGDGNDMFGTKNPGRHPFKFNRLRLTDGLLGETVRRQKLHRESPHDEMFALNVPTLRLQARVNGRDTGG